MNDAALPAAPWPEMRLDEFMQRAVSHYYATRDPFTDFTTAPEISQVFGELLGGWIVVTWVQLGRPAPFRLVEAGPGRGTLMQDAWRLISRTAPACAAAARLHLIETSPYLRGAQKSRLPHATWHDRLAELPDGPVMLLANEFLDTLPLRQFVRQEAGWAERYVLDGKFTLRPAEPPVPPPPGGGDIFEICEAARAWVAELSDRLRAQGGAALLIDYGYGESATGDSLQAFRGSKYADPLADPGEADITAHVDFGVSAEIARAHGLHAWGPVTQGALLTRLGLPERISRLIAENPEQEAALTKAAHRLTHGEQMGTLFKALAVTAANFAPAGFE